MHHLNKLRLNAGLTMDLALETQQASEENKLTEARETPKRRSELTGKDKKSLKSQERGVKRAMEHVKQAIAVLEKIPATDYRGEIPHFIGELEDLLDGGEGGMTGYLDNISGEAADFGKEPEMDDMDMEPEMEPELDAEPMDDMEPEMGDDEEMSFEAEEEEC